MLKITGNKEFIEWWEHWMSRIHPHRSSVDEGKGTKAPSANKKPTNTNKRKEAVLESRMLDAPASSQRKHLNPQLKYAHRRRIGDPNRHLAS
jgi:hypothetical protein